MVKEDIGEEEGKVSNLRNKLEQLIQSQREENSNRKEKKNMDQKCIKESSNTASKQKLFNESNITFQKQEKNNSKNTQYLNEINFISKSTFKNSRIDNERYEQKEHNEKDSNNTNESNSETSNFSEANFKNLQSRLKSKLTKKFFEDARFKKQNPFYTDYQK